METSCTSPYIHSLAHRCGCAHCSSCDLMIAVPCRRELRARSVCHKTGRDGATEQGQSPQASYFTPPAERTKAANVRLGLIDEKTLGCNFPGPDHSHAQFFKAIPEADTAKALKCPVLQQCNLRWSPSCRSSGWWQGSAAKRPRPMRHLGSGRNAPQSFQQPESASSSSKCNDGGECIRPPRFHLHGKFPVAPRAPKLGSPATLPQILAVMWEWAAQRCIQTHCLQSVPLGFRSATFTHQYLDAARHDAPPPQGEGRSGKYAILRAQAKEDLHSCPSLPSPQGEVQLDCSDSLGGCRLGSRSPPLADRTPKGSIPPAQILS
eukprot:scaffold147909_cov31-Tisochrysis_lutea.AAC.3